MRQLLSNLNRVLECMLVVSLAALIIPVSLQVFSRHTDLIPTFFWTEEIAVLLLSWVVMLGATIAVREASHFQIDLWPRLSPRSNAILDIVAGTLMLGFAMIFVIYGIDFALAGRQQLLVMTGLPKWIMYVAWPLAGLLWCVFIVEKLWDAAAVIRYGETPVADRE